MNIDKDKLIDEITDIAEKSASDGYNHNYAERLAEQLVDRLVKKMNYMQSSLQLKDKETPTIKDAFIAGYKKRAEMSGLKYDDVSELNAITCFKCWKSFDL